jgi:hypothetical protein
MTRRRIIAALPFLLSVCAAAPQAFDGLRKLSDADVLAVAHSDYSKADKMGRSQVLGSHHGIALVADYPCSDVCPMYTTRIIHYALPADDKCMRMGGVVRMRNVPVSIAMVRQPFCVPAVIAGD